MHNLASNGSIITKEWKILEYICPLLSENVSTREDDFFHNQTNARNPLHAIPIIGKESIADYVIADIGPFPFICISTPEAKALTSVLIADNSQGKEILLSREHVGYDRMLDLEVAMHQLFSLLIQNQATSFFFNDPNKVAIIDILREAASYSTQKSLSGLMKNGHPDYIVRDMITAAHRKKPEISLGRTVEIIKPKLEGLEGRANWIIADSPASGLTPGAVLEYMIEDVRLDVKRVIFAGQYASYKAVMALSGLCSHYGIDAAFASLGASLMSDDKMYFSAFPRDEWRAADARETRIIKQVYGDTPFCIGGDFTANVENPPGAIKEFLEEQKKFGVFPKADRLDILKIMPEQDITPYSTRINRARQIYL